MKKIAGVILFSVILFGCSTQQKNTVFPKRSPIIIGKSQRVIKSVTYNKKPQNTSKKHYKVSIVYVPIVKETSPLLKTYSKNNISESEERKRAFKISVENMPTIDFINLVFGKILKTDYFIDKSVSNTNNKITLNIKKAVTKKEFVDIVLAILKQYGITVTKNDGIYFIKKGLNTTKEIITKYIMGRTMPDGLLPSEKIGAIIPLYYVKASVYADILRRLALSRNAFIQVVPNQNTIFIVDYAKYIKFALNYIDLFDRPLFSNKQAVLLKFEYISPSNFVKKVRNILPLQGIPIASSMSEPGILFKPLDDISSLFVLSPRKKWLRFVYFWKNRLDTISALGDQPRFFVYYPKNRRASDLAKVFSQISSSVVLTKKGHRVVKTSKSNIKVIVDEGRNALVILAQPLEYEQIKSVLDSLDTLPKEVLVQVTIAEITLTNSLQYGIEWYLKHTGRYTGVLQTIGGLGLGAGGLNYSIVSDTSKFQALLNAFASKDLINVISSPRLVVLDNHEAAINVGTQVPTVTSESNSDNIQDNGTTSLLRTISYRDTGVILNIRPTINSGGILTLNIHQEVSEPQVNNTSKIDSPLILNRDITTSVVLKSGSTLLLGGLIKKNKSSTIKKIPLLGDIPILGNLFKTTSKGTTKTELIIEITPYIISNMEEAQAKTKNFESLMKWFKKEKTSGYITQ